MSKFKIPVDRIRLFKENNRNSLNNTNNPNNNNNFDYLINFINKELKKIAIQQNDFNKLKYKGLIYLQNPNNINHFLIVNIPNKMSGDIFNNF